MKNIILSKCDLLEVVAYAGEFWLIYDTWALIQSVLVEKRIRKEGKLRFLVKIVLVELRRVNHFLMIFVLTS